MERDPEQPAVIHFKLNGEVIDATPENTLGFTHQDEADKQYDHIFVFDPEDMDDDEVVEGRYFWRHEVPEFDRAIERMRELGFTVVTHEDVQDSDKAAYDSNSQELEPKDLTPRQEDRVAYLAHLLLSDRLTPEDFATPGELYI